MRISTLACINWNRAIGINNGLLYNLKKDMNWFQDMTINPNPTKKNAVIMGSNTYLSIPKKFRPLDQRLNIIISKNKYSMINKEIKYNRDKNAIVFPCITQSLKYLHTKKNVEDLFVIGGESIYDYFIKNRITDNIILAEIEKTQHTPNIGTVYFPKFDKTTFIPLNSSKTISEKNVKCYVDGSHIPEIKYQYKTYRNIRPWKKCDYSDEGPYLDVLRDVLNHGEVRDTRNSKTISKFGLRMEFDISNYFPLITTKKMFWKGVVEELLWFLKADTNSINLENNGVNIWKGNSSREYLDSIDLKEYQPGWCGPIYGFQWRHFNAKYLGPEHNYQNQGIDQLQNCLDLIKYNPDSRRIFMSGWNPEQMAEMALPPCHVSYQFYVDSNNNLSCQMYQRSGDLFLGVPFNIASTALLTNIMAKMSGKKPGKIIIVIGDGHIYSNHIEQINKQLSRETFCFPQLSLKEKTNFEDYTIDDFTLMGYQSHPSIKADMVA